MKFIHSLFHEKALKLILTTMLMLHIRFQKALFSINNRCSIQLILHISCHIFWLSGLLFLMDPFSKYIILDVISLLQIEVPLPPL